MFLKSQLELLVPERVPYGIFTVVHKTFLKRGKSVATTFPRLRRPLQRTLMLVQLIAQAHYLDFRTVTHIIRNACSYENVQAEFVDSEFSLKFIVSVTKTLP